MNSAGVERNAVGVECCLIYILSVVYCCYPTLVSVSGVSVAPETAVECFEKRSALHRREHQPLHLHAKKMITRSNLSRQILTGHTKAGVDTCGDGIDLGAAGG